MTQPAGARNQELPRLTGRGAGRRRFIAATLGAVAATMQGSGCSSSSDEERPRPISDPPPARPVTFPLSIGPSGRHLVDAVGQPFLVLGDAAWSIVGQLNDSEIDEYLQARQSQGFTAVLFSAPEAYYTGHRPAYLNADGQAPFEPMTDFSSPNGRYWARVDHVVDGAKARGMACIVNPAYLGYEIDGWLAAVSAASDDSLQSYGRWLAQRYAQGNIIWCMGGDHDGPPSLLRKQWNIALGILSVRGEAIVTAHQMSDSSNADDAYAYWSGFPGFALNAVYGYETNGKFTDALCDQARSRPMPFLGFEFKYENSEGATQAMLRRQSYGALLSGACGQIYGNNPVWHFGSPAWTETYPGTWRSNLHSPGAVYQSYLNALFGSIAWWKLRPVTDGSLVTSSLGSGATRIYPALADDGSLAIVYVPQGQAVTVRLVDLQAARLRVRLLDPTSGLSEAVAVDQADTEIRVVTEGERLIVMDAA